MKLVKRGFVLTLAVLAAVFLLVTLRDRRQKISVYENRTLAAHPAFSVQSLWDGSYFDGWDEYFADHVAWRDDLLRDYLWLQLYGKRQVIINDVVITDRTLLPNLGCHRDDSGLDFSVPAKAAADRLANIQQAVETYGGRFLFLGIDEQRTALADAYPAYVYSRADYYSAIERAFRAAAAERGLSVLFLRDLIQDADPASLYSKVDHHFNLRGAYWAYAAICKWSADHGLAVTAIPEKALGIHPTEGMFYGSYSRKLYDLSPVQEQLLVFDETVFPPYERWDNGERTDAPLLELPSEGEPVQYHAYMGGDKGETVIRTNRPELPNVLIVGDSFTNPVEALCTASFNELRSLDFRHYDAMTLTEYLAEYPADLVVVIRDNLNYIGAEANGDLS